MDTHDRLEDIHPTDHSDYVASLTYYNGCQITRAGVKSLRIESRGYGFQDEVLVKALRKTRTYVEVPMDLIERTKGESKAFRAKNFVDVYRR